MRGIGNFRNLQSIFVTDYRRNLVRSYGYQFVRENHLFRDLEKWNQIPKKELRENEILSEKYGSIKKLEKLVIENQTKICNKYPERSIPEKYFETIELLQTEQIQTKNIRSLMLRHHQIRVPEGMNIRQVSILFLYFFFKFLS